MNYSANAIKPLLRQLLLTFCMALVLVCPITRPALAQIVVTDPGNTSQNLLTALRSLQSNVNEAQQLSYSLQNLQKLNFTSSAAYSSQYLTYMNKIQSLQGALSNTISAESNFQRMYPTFATSPTYNGSSMLSNMSTWQTSLSKSMGDSVGTSSSVINSIPSTQANMSNLLNASNSSQGFLQATQAGNQMTATVSNQLTQMNGQLATYETAHMQYIAQQQSQQAAQAAASDYLRADYTNVGSTNAINMPGNR